MYIHDKKSGLITPLPLYLIWKYKVHIFIFGAVAQCLAPFVFMGVPKEAPTESSLSFWHKRCLLSGKDPSVCQLNYPTSKP
jgi:hypothetical protein